MNDDVCNMGVRNFFFSKIYMEGSAWMLNDCSIQCRFEKGDGAILRLLRDCLSAILNRRSVLEFGMAYEFFQSSLGAEIHEK